MNIWIIEKHSIYQKDIKYKTWRKAYLPLFSSYNGEGMILRLKNKNGHKFYKKVSNVFCNRNKARLYKRLYDNGLKTGEIVNKEVCFKIRKFESK